ncbi:MAG: hypothetical protein EOO38_02420 [Cytophagaceae bacterium]|nr:MAG: hypothetical protein EOO38_02420 [Cytophagaceae bacterium]
MIKREANVNETKLRAPAVVGVDIGSTNSKVVILDPDGRIVCRQSRPTPRSTFDLSVAAMELLSMLEEMIVQACGDSYSVQAVAIAGIGEDGVLVDARLNPLTPAMAWFDPRRRDLFAHIQPLLDASTDDLGVFDDPARTLAGWYWAQHQPNVDAAHAWLALTDFSASYWAGSPFMSDTLAARTGAWKVGQGQWSVERVEACLSSTALLPPVRSAGEIIGPLRSAKLHRAGVLLEDAVVVAGGHDHPVGGWGVNQMRPESILDSMGTAEVVVAQSSGKVVRHQDVDVAHGICSEGTSLLSVHELSRNVEWASQEPGVKSALRAIITGSLRPDSYLTSECFIAGGRGGESPHFSSDCPDDHISRASAVAGALSRLGNASVENIAKHMHPDAVLFCAGGWARSRGWIDLKQSLGMRDIQVIGEPEVTAVGAALLAATAINWKVDASVALSGGLKADTCPFSAVKPALVS